ncbi:MAG: ABC transporter permease [Desulfobacteraceae bacterium]|nr:ABC transporter permease [Desulfobacteraceae bacterium]MBC2749286.1 Gldg family protein [Desulfobacteraceae bacterium]
MATRTYDKYMKFSIYLLVLVLLNIAGLTLFFRWDLTSNHIYSLSQTSKQVVATLQEPLTIKVFFTKNLPAPYNNTERYLHDLLEEYALHANRNFNYRFYDVSPQEGDVGLQAGENQQQATDYGINPVQIQAIEEDEVKFKRAYMGLALIHGDMVEQIPTITSIDGLEYKLTTAIQKLNNKTSAFLNLKDSIQVTLFLSSSLKGVAQYMGLDELPSFAERLEGIIKKVNAKTYNKLSYRHIDPSRDSDGREAAKQYNIMTINWPAIPEANLAPGNGVIGLVMAYGDKTVTTPLLNVLRLPIIGTQYQMVGIDEMEGLINDNLEALVDINENLGYLVSNGTLALDPMPGRQNNVTLRSFTTLVSDSYSLQRIELQDKPIPASLPSLIIARPTEPFSNYDLYQIDQALMRGTNLILLLDSFMERGPGAPQTAFMQGPSFEPVDTGLGKLLATYGVKITPSMVLDENCYKQRLPSEMGGGERPIYFAPLIKSTNINQDLPYMENIRGLIALKMSPLVLDEKQLEGNGLSATRLFSSSDQSWEMKDRITLDPMMIGSPPPAEDLQTYPLAYILEGEFPSHFAGQPIPEKPAPAEAEAPDTAEADIETDAPAGKDLSGIESTTLRRDKGQPAKILMVGSAELIQDSVLEADGRTPNSMFMMNVIDYLNDRGDVAVMRSKEQRFNPLEDPTPAMRTMTKAVNIAGLPILVVLFGVGVWLRRIARKKRIQAMFLQS